MRAATLVPPPTPTRGARGTVQSARRRRWPGAAVPGAMLFLLALAQSATPVRAGVPALIDAHGMHVDAVEMLDARQLHVQLSTAALQQPVDVRILLPTDYLDTARRYPVLYLFHGTSGRASDWVTDGEAEDTTADLPLIVVMPDCGFDGDGGGWFADWFNAGAYGPPMWETFHVEQLLPWVDANLRTIATDSGRAVAGLSQGGFGSLSYAARHPDLFTSVAAFSGACEIDRDAEAIRIATTIIQFTTQVLSGNPDPDAVFGPRATESLNWQAHDPATLVTNLRGLDIELWTGDGDQGPFDPGPPNAPPDAIETIVFGATTLFDGHLTDAGIPHAYNYYGSGTHSWPYWARDLREYVGPLMQRFAHPPAPRRAVGFLSADEHWERFGWSVGVLHDQPGFTQLHYASRRGFALTGTGSASVRTPPLYDAGAHVRVRMRARAFSSTSNVVIDESGRLRLTVPLGDGSRPRTTRVSIQVLTGY